MPRDAVSRTANVERNGGHKWVSLPATMGTKVDAEHQVATDGRFDANLLNCTFHGIAVESGGSPDTVRRLHPYGIGHLSRNRTIRR